MKRVLSIDGGGIRGLIPAVVCRYIEEQAEEPIHQLFDLIAGTSTGGIIAMALALPPSGTPASDLVKFYENDGPRIFSHPRRGWRHYFSKPKFSNDPLREIVKKQFGDATIRNALKDVLVTSYDIKYSEHFIISRRLAIKELALAKAKDPIAGKHDGYPMWQVAMATSAAPTYFSPSVLDDRVLIDGGIVANNPACLALAEAHQLWPDSDSRAPLRSAQQAAVIATGNTRSGSTTNSGCALFGRRKARRTSRSWTTIRRGRDNGQVAQAHASRRGSAGGVPRSIDNVGGRSCQSLRVASHADRADRQRTERHYRRYRASARQGARNNHPALAQPAERL
jgi:hypothetical protein